MTGGIIWVTGHSTYEVLLRTARHSSNDTVEAGHPLSTLTTAPAITTTTGPGLQDWEIGEREGYPKKSR